VRSNNLADGFVSTLASQRAALFQLGGVNSRRWVLSDLIHEVLLSFGMSLSECEASPKKKANR
jgi:hypothetical protein